MNDKIDSISKLVSGATTTPTLSGLVFDDILFDITIGEGALANNCMRLPFCAEFDYGEAYSIKVPLSAKYVDGSAQLAFVHCEAVTYLLKDCRYAFKGSTEHRAVIRVNKDNNLINESILALDKSGETRIKKGLITFADDVLNTAIIDGFLSALDSNSNTHFEEGLIAEIDMKIRANTSKQLGGEGN